MKKLLTFGMIIIIAFAKFNTVTYAFNYRPVEVNVAVEITEGGTAVIIPSVNCPIPNQTSLDIKDGVVGKFHIAFTTVGTYDYTVKTIPDKRKLKFDDKVYRIRIYVTDEGGELVTTIIASIEDEKYSAHSVLEGYSEFGPERLKFKNIVPEGKDGNPKEKKPPKDKEIKKIDDGNDFISSEKNRNPKTEDDTKMELYFLCAILASAGLLILSIIDLIETQKMIKEVRNC